MIILTTNTEAEFAAALDLALETGQPIEAPLEVVEAFGIPDCGPDSAEWLDVEGRPWLALVSGSDTPTGTQGPTRAS